LSKAGYTIVKDALTAYGRRYYAAVMGKDNLTRIFVALLEGSRDMGWGYKDMDETMGPCVYDCPMSVLKMADPVDVAYAGEGRNRATASDWRAEVSKYHARREHARATAKSLKVGDVVWLRNTRDNPFTIASVTPKLRGYGKSGTLYRLPKSRVSRVELDKPV
jgi:hypothetical protein